MLLNVREVAVATDPLAGGRHVVEVALLHARSGLDALERKGLEIFLWHEPRFVRPVDAAGEEERLCVLPLELFADPFCHQPVAAELLVGHVERGPVRLDILPGTAAGQAHRALRRMKRAGEGIVGRLVREIVVPRLGIDDVVQHLSRAGGAVAVTREVARQQFRPRHDLAHLLRVLIEPRAMRRQAAEDGRARRIARGRGAIGVAEQHAARGETVQIRRLRLRMPAEAADPVVEVVERNEEHVGLLLGRGGGRNAAEQRDGREGREESTEHAESGK